MSRHRFKLDDDALRQRILGAIAAGSGLHAALRANDVAPQTYRNYVKVYPEFADTVQAMVEASMEPIAQAMRAKALDGDVTASKEYRAYVDRTSPAPEGRGNAAPLPATGSTSIDLDSISSGDLAAIAALNKELANRSEESNPAIGPGDE